MRRRNKLILWFLPAFGVLGLAGLLYTLLHTAPGARWAWQQAVQNVPGRMEAARVTGNLRGGVILDGVVYTDDSVAVSADRLEARLSFALFPPAVDIERLSANRISLVLLDSSPSDKGSTTADTLKSLELPLPLTFSSVRIGHFTIEDAAREELIDLSAVNIQADWHDALDLHEAQFNTGALEWSLTAALDFTAPFPVRGEVDTHIPAGSGGLDLPSDLNIKASLSGSLLLSEFEVHSDLGGLSASGTLRDLTVTPEWEFDLVSEFVEWPLGASEPYFRLHGLSMTFSGQPLDYQLQATARFQTEDLPISDVSLTARGDITGLQFSDVQVSGELADLAASGQLSWQDELRFAFTTRLNRFNPGFWLEDWPQEHPMGGTFDLTWREESLWFENLDIGVENSPGQVTGSAQYDPFSQRLTAGFSWRSLQWPVAGGPADFESPSGQLSLSGQADGWTAQGSLELKSAEWPSGLLQLNAEGDEESVTITVDEGQVLGGRFAGQFSYQWTGNQPWSARILSSNLDLSSLSDQVSGRVNANLEARGQSNPLAIELDIRELDGRINGRAVSGQGSLVMESGNWRARALNVRSGDSFLRLDGNLQAEDGLSFSLHIESLSELDENASGSFSGEGRVSVNAAHPLLEMNAQGAALVWNDWQAETLQVTTESINGNQTIRLEVPGLLRGDQVIENVVFSSGGDSPLQSLQISAESEGTVLDVRLNGEILNWAEFPDTQWEGLIESLSLRNESLGFLELEQPGRLLAGPDSVRIDPACVLGSRNGQVCFELNWKNQERFTSDVRLNRVSLHLVQLLLGSRLEFSQTVDGEVSWQEEHGKKATADVKFTLSPGQVTSEDKSASLETGAGQFSFRISEGQLLAGNLDIDLPGSGVINTDFSVPDISNGIDSAIQGRIQVELNSIESIMSWIPQLDSANGTVNADVRVAGTLTDPKLTGHASLVRGSFEHLASGLTVTNIQLAGAVYDYDYTELNGSFTSGDGRGQIKASVQFDKILKPTITLELAGQNLTLVDIPDMTVKANPDLRLRWQDSALDLDGKVLIPSARIAPRYLPNTSASESTDLVFVGEQPPVLEESYIDRSRLRLNGQVEVVLGDDVTVTFQRATAKLSGQSIFTWNDNLMPLANGTFLVSGKISAYGQLLEVADGRVSFPGVPADNPHLNINAEREIYGNLQVKKAGVLISGTLKRPVLETYTIPATSQERALTLLVTGHDFDYEQGVGAVEVGMYIAPKLYVSYGVGLFEAQSVISARYDLGKGFGIKATSGQRETGADITYTIEN